MPAIKLIFAAVLCAAIALPAWSNVGTPIDLAQVRAQQQEIRADLVDSKGRYSDLPPRRRDEIIAKQDSLLRLIDGKEMPGDLSDRQQLEMINDLEWIQAAINQAEDERVTCRSEKLTGSHMVKKICRTNAQIRAEREDARNSIERRALCTEGQPCAGRD
jgi:hypothetical protein